MIRQGVDTFVEIGPGRTLAGFMRKIDRNVKVYVTANILAHNYDLDGAREY